MTRFGDRKFASETFWLQNHLIAIKYQSLKDSIITLLSAENCKIKLFFLSEVFSISFMEIIS
jgi:hypothetical protein